MEMHLYQKPLNKRKNFLKLDTVKDRVAAFMIGEIKEDQLHKGDEVMLSRWTRIWSLLSNYHSYEQAVRVHQEQQKKMGEPISHVTAYTDLKNATDLWGDLIRVNERAQWLLLYEYQIKGLQMAMAKKNLREFNSAISSLIKINEHLSEFFTDEEVPTTYVLELYFKNEESPRSFSLNNLDQIPENDFYQIVEAVEEDELDTVQMQKLLKEAKEHGKKRNSTE